MFDALIGHPTHGSKRYIYEQYDNQVGANTVHKSGFGSGVVRVEGTDKAIAMAIDGKSRYVYADPLNGGKEAVAQTFRSIISTGALPLAMTDCLNYGSPEKPEIYHQLEASTRGMAEACEMLSTPVVSGNVSLYNESKGTILPTPVIGMVGLIEDVNFMAGVEISAGDALYLVGETTKSFAGSQIEKLIDNEIRKQARHIDLELEYARGMDLRGRLIDGEVKRITPVGRGGIAIKLAQLSAFHRLGVDVEVDLDGEDLFAENASRYIVIAPAGLDIKDGTEIGRLTDEGFHIGTHDLTIDRSIDAISNTWEGAIPQCMTSTD